MAAGRDSNRAAEEILIKLVHECLVRVLVTDVSRASHAG
jgi:hypothetical protein